MSTIVNTEFGRILVSALGALVLTTGCFAFAAAPARAAMPHTAGQVVVTVAPATGLVGAVRY